MTVIAYRDGLMASDSRAYSGDKVPIGSKRKVHRIAAGPMKGGLVGISSTEPGVPEAFVRWIAGEADDDMKSLLKDAKFLALVVRPEGDVLAYIGSLCPTGPLEAPFYAVGSGECYALGAFSMGADARRAVEVAMEHDVWSAGAVQCLSLEALP